MSELVHAPAQLTQDELVALLEDVLAGVRSGDTLEGFVEFLIGDAPETGDWSGWDVRARYRAGNTLGQGSWRMVGALVERRNTSGGDVC